MNELNSLSVDDAVRWCDSTGLAVDGVGGQMRLSFPDSQFGVRFTIPAEAQKILALSYVILMTCVPQDDEELFPGGLVWVNEWGIGSGTFERLGNFIVERLAGVALGSHPAFTSPGFDALYALLVQTMTYQWDAHYVPRAAPFLCHVSHDGYVEIVAKDQATHDLVASRFEKGRWGKVENSFASDR